MTTNRGGRHSLRRRWYLDILALYPLGLIGLALSHLVAPQRGGLAGLSLVFAPYLFLPLLALLPLAFWRRSRLLISALLVCGVIFWVRFLPPVTSAPPAPPPAAAEIEALSWNLYVSRTPPDEIRRMLNTYQPDIVAFQEVNWHQIAREAAVGDRYPYEFASLPDRSQGMVLLSRYPFLEQGMIDLPYDGVERPRILWVRLDLGNGQTLLVVNAHPKTPDTFGRGCAYLICYDTSVRDRHIRQLRELIEPWLAAGENVLLMGDFNTTERELAYQDLRTGLYDAHRRAGSGSGNSWRPDALVGWGITLLRIDYMFVSPQIDTLELATDCSVYSSDHCLLQGRFALR